MYKQVLALSVYPAGPTLQPTNHPMVTCPTCGEYLSNLRYADDIVLLSHSFNELHGMLDELVREGRKVGLKVNVTKTKLMANRPTGTVQIDRREVEKVESFIYLGSVVSTMRCDGQELRRRIRAGWFSFHRYSDFFRDRRIRMDQKRKLYNMCVLPAMLYGSETWALTKKMEMDLAVAQRRMERMMVGVTVLDRRTNEWLRGVTKAEDVVREYRQRKWKYAVKVADMGSERWVKKVTEWWPRSGQRKVGRPRRRWRDEVTRFAGVNWMTTVRSNQSDVIREAFIRNEL